MIGATLLGLAKKGKKLLLCVYEVTKICIQGDMRQLYLHAYRGMNGK
jgi:hypothetical protein